MNTGCLLQFYKKKKLLLLGYLPQIYSESFLADFAIAMIILLCWIATQVRLGQEHFIFWETAKQFEQFKAILE